MSLAVRKDLDIYIPANRRTKLETVASRPRLPLELVRVIARNLFRSIPWDGESRVALEQPPNPTAPESFSPRTPARVAFAKVAWTGEKAEPPTVKQGRLSTRTVLDSFHWE